MVRRRKAYQVQPIHKKNQNVLDQRLNLGECVIERSYEVDEVVLVLQELRLASSQAGCAVDPSLQAFDVSMGGFGEAQRFAVSVQ